jgi:hypothetical protein
MVEKNSIYQYQNESLALLLALLRFCLLLRLCRLNKVPERQL